MSAGSAVCDALGRNYGGPPVLCCGMRRVEIFDAPFPGVLVACVLSLEPSDGQSGDGPALTSDI